MNAICFAGNEVASIWSVRMVIHTYRRLKGNLISLKSTWMCLKRTITYVNALKYSSIFFFTLIIKWSPRLYALVISFSLLCYYFLKDFVCRLSIARVRIFIEFNGIPALQLCRNSRCLFTKHLWISFDVSAHLNQHMLLLYYLQKDAKEKDSKQRRMLLTLPILWWISQKILIMIFEKNRLNMVYSTKNEWLRRLFREYSSNWSVLSDDIKYQYVMR